MKPCKMMDLVVINFHAQNFVGLLQSETQQRPHKVSFFVEKVKALEIMSFLSEHLEKRGVRILVDT